MNHTLTNCEASIAWLAIDPITPIPAGVFGSWTATITVGELGIDDGGTLRLTQRGSSDWQPPQFTIPAGEGFTFISSNSSAELLPTFSFKGHVRPYFWCLTIDVRGNPLSPGDIVTIILGDRRFGSPGIRAQTFREREHEFGLEVDPTNSNLPRRADRVLLEIIPGQAERLSITVPSSIGPGDRLRPSVMCEDIWGNRTVAEDSVELSWEGSEICTQSEDGWLLRGTAYGRFRARAQGAPNELVGYSNPIRVGTAPLNHFWGDLHAQTGATVGAGNEDEYYRFARDVAHLDFCGHQANDFQISDSYWAHLNRKSREYTVEGGFIVLPGYEWSANTPVGGDHNIWYLNEDAPIFRSSQWLLEPFDPTSQSAFSAKREGDHLACTLAELYERLADSTPPGEVLIGLHAGGRYSNPELPMDPRFPHLVEVVSCWGVFEWLLFGALSHRLHLGVVGNSDGHKGRPGAEHPGAGEFGRRGGLTCVLAPSLSRAAIFEALAHRRCYATTGARIVIDLDLAGSTMGQVVRLAGRSHLDVSVFGTAPLEKIELFRGDKCIAAIVPTAEFVPPADFHPSTHPTVRISYGGARSRGRERRMTWQGTVTTTDAKVVAASPIGFHSPADWIRSRADHSVEFCSRTGGDVHAIDLQLTNLSGEIAFVTEQGETRFEVSKLETVQRRPLGGLDLFVAAQIYYGHLSPTTLHCTFPIDPEEQEYPYLVKVTQSDGELAWTSPIYISFCPERQKLPIATA